MGMKDFLIDIGMPVDPKYHIRPQGHETHKWISQDGSISLVTDLDDFHLLNIYILLRKSIDMMHELIKNTYPRNDAAKLIEETEELRFMEKNFCHIAYEVHARGLYVRRHNIYETTDGQNKNSFS